MVEETVTQQVRARYARAVSTGEQMCCPTGYDFEELRRFIPEAVLKVSYGCGTPAGLNTVHPGETVLDIGSGGGIDCFDAARRVGPMGRVIGIDMTDAMLDMARRHAPEVAAKLGYPAPNTEFRKGMADAMPVEDDRVDLIISNCVINLAPDKRQVFQEMHRVLKPGGRFTISDIVSDQAMPNYLIHDAGKWGDCLSGALQVRDYFAGLNEAGLLGVHQITFLPWRVIDGIHFLSITLTGYKLPSAAEPNGVRFATLRGPFLRVTDEYGRSHRRGVPQAVDARTAQLLQTPALAPLFVFSGTHEPLLASDPRLTAVLPAAAPCVWQGEYAVLTGPVVEAEDDDNHVFLRGQAAEICSKTLDVLRTDAYRPHFAVFNRAAEPVTGSEVSCDPGGPCC